MGISTYSSTRKPGDADNRVKLVRSAQEHVNYHIISPGSMHDTGCSGLVHWDDPVGWDGEGGGRGLQVGENMYTHGGFKSMHGKTNIML